MNYYYLIDFIFLALIIYFCIQAYKKQYYAKIFEYIKIFIFLSISAKLAPFSGLLFKKYYLINADSYSIMILLAFTINFFILLYSYKYILSFINNYLHNKTIKNTCAKVLSFIEIILLVSFLTFILMQVSLIKEYVSPVINKSYSYKYIKKFYITFLNEDFVIGILQSDTQTNHKELLFKSIKKLF